jgi:hypothetical protein
MVTSEDAVKFKHFMNNDKIDHNRSRPYYPMYYDRDHDYMKERSFWLGVIALGAGTSYLIAKWTIESDRRKMWTRLGSVEDLPGEQFKNYGGILVMKQTSIFDQYFGHMSVILGLSSRAP